MEYKDKEITSCNYKAYVIYVVHNDYFNLVSQSPLNVTVVDY